MNDLAYVLTIATGIASAIVGGVLFAFSAFIMKALARISADRGIAAMQSINIAVQNWLCSLLFFGTGLTCIVLLVWSLMNWGSPGTGYLLAGGISYVLGGLLVTGAFNVPLNDRLAKVDPVSEEGNIVWRRFVPVWMVWNHIRTVACFAASITFIAGLLEM